MQPVKGSGELAVLLMALGRGACTGQKHAGHVVKLQLPMLMAIALC
jgi:hypothetical protein